MLKPGNIFCLLIALIIINGCKKDPKIEKALQASSFNCGRTSFSDTIFVTLNSPSKISSSISGINNIYVATPGTNSLDVVKMDCDANFIWKKSYTYGTEKVISVSALGKYDDFYVLTATDNFTIMPGTSTIQAWVSYYETPNSNTINCDRGVSAYNFEPNFVPDRTFLAQSNYSRLYKYDGAGNLQWQKNLTGNFYDNLSLNYLNTGLSADTNNNIYVLTAERKTYTPQEVFTFTPSTYPYYAMPLDSNGFTVTKIDPFGNQVSSVTIENVHNTNYYVGGTFFCPSLSLSKNNLNVTCDRYVYVFDMNLGYLNKVSPVSDNCVDKRMFSLNNPNVSNSVFHISYNDGISYRWLFEKWNGVNKLNSTIYSDQLYIDGIPCMDDNQNFYFCVPSTGRIRKFDTYGMLVYSLFLQFGPNAKTCLTSKMDQVFVFDYTSLGRLYVFKPDANGNF